MLAEQINITKCNNLQEYVNCIHHLGKSKRYPIINDEIASRLIKSLEIESIDFNISEYQTLEEDIFDSAVSSVLRHNDAIDDNLRIIITLKKEEVITWIALHHAKLTKQRIYLAEDFEDAFEFIQTKRPQFVTFVSVNSDVEVRYISRLQGLQNQLFGTNNEMYFSILTARRPNALISLIIRNDIFKQYSFRKYIHINRIDYLNKFVTKEGDLEIYPHNKATLAEIKLALVEDKANVTTIIGHGRDEMAWLTDGVICGKSCFLKHNEGEEEVNRPSCVYTGKCYKADMTVISAFDINTRHLLMNSCFSAKTEGASFGDDYNIMLAFLDGHVVSYLGSSFIVDGKDFLNYYYLAQIRSGIPLGIAAAYVNKCYSDSSLGHKWSFYLIGDSTFSLPQNSIPLAFKYDASFHDDIDSPKQEFCVPHDVDLITIEFESESLKEEYFNLENRLTIYSTNGQPIYGVFRKKNKSTFIDIFSTTSIKKCNLVVSLKGGARFNLSSIEKLEYLNVFGMNPENKFKPYLIESKDSALRLAKDYKYHMNELSAIHNNVYKKYDKINERVSKLSYMIVKHLQHEVHNKGFAWEEHCIANGLIYKSADKSEEVCPNCNKELYIMKYRHEIYNNLKRAHYCCQSCGVMKDFPAENLELCVYFEGDTNSYINGVLEQNLVIVNQSNYTVYGLGGIAISRGGENEITYDNTVSEFEVLPYEKKTIPYRVQFSENTIPHLYWLRGIVMVNGDIYSIKKDIYVSQ